MKELKVGEKVEFEVIEQSPSAKDLCEGCYFNSEYGCQRDCRIFGACSKGRRSDNKDVIFKGVKA